MSARPQREIPAPNPQPELLSISEAARTLHLSGQTVREMFHSGKLPGVRIGNMIKLFSESVYNLLTPTQTPKGI